MSIFKPKSKREKAAAAAKQERLRAKLERKAFPKLVREFNRVARDAARAFSRSRSITTTILAVDEHKTRMAAILRPLYARTINETTRMMLKAAPKSRVLHREKKDTESMIDRLIEEYVTGRSLEKATRISATTKDIIAKVIQAGLDAGEGEAVIAKEITSKVSSIGRSRARTIARTETHAAAQNASLEVARDFFSETKEWVPVEDDRTRRTHEEMDGVKIPIYDWFHVGDTMVQFPGDPRGSAKETINCRCVLVYE